MATGIPEFMRRGWIFSFLRFSEDKDQCFVRDKSQASERNTIGVKNRNLIEVCLSARW